MEEGIGHWVVVRHGAEWCVCVCDGNVCFGFLRLLSVAMEIMAPCIAFQDLFIYFTFYPLRWCVQFTLKLKV